MFPMPTYRNEERKLALSQLITATRDPTVWDDNFKNVLRLLIETIGDKDSGVRVLALRTLCELLKRQVHRFQSYIELTLLKILEAHIDNDKEVTLLSSILQSLP